MRSIRAAGRSASQRRVGALFALAALFVTSACEPEIPGRATVVGGDGVRVPTLVNGTAYSGRASVGTLQQNGQFSCTATLVGKQTVLTAAHCVQQGASYSFVVGGQTYQVKSAVVHPSFQPQNQIGDDDIAVMLLASAPSVAPAALAQSAPTVGLAAVLVGYGLTSTYANDDGVRRGATASIGVVQAKRIGLLDPSKGLTCNGDSGGPMFATLNGKEYVVGVVSGATQPGCGIDSYYARVDVYLQWIQTTAKNDVNLAGATPEPPPNNAPSQPGQPTPPGGQPPLTPPGGQPPLTPPGQPPTAPGQGAFGAQCHSGFECQSSVCAVDQLGAGFCSTLCSSQQDCPSSPCYPTMQGVGVCGLSGGQPTPPGQPYPPNQPGQPYPPTPPGQPVPPNQPGQPVAPGGGGQIGTPCQSTQQCYGGVCVAGQGAAGICTTVCAGSSGGFGGGGFGGGGFGGGGFGGGGFGGYGNGFGGFGCPAGAQCVPTDVPGLSVCM